MAIFTANFYKKFIEEGSPFYIDRYNTNAEKFNEWIVNNFLEKGTIHSFQEIAPSSVLIEEFKKSGYIHKPYSCHYSAKAINIINPQFEYWTGFVHRQESINPIITHSFNIFKNSIIDFSRINENIYNRGFSTFPHIYYGINIPSDFVIKYKAETFSHYSMNPLLFEWFNYKKAHDL